MTDSDRYDANVALIEEYLKEEFPGCDVSSYRYNSANTKGFDIGAHTFKVDCGERKHLARATDELLRDFRDRDLAAYLSRRPATVAEIVKTVPVRLGYVLLKTTGPQIVDAPPPKIEVEISDE